MATIANLFTWTTWIETTQTGTSYYGQAGYQASTNFVARSDAFTVSSYTCVTEITVSYSQNTHGTSTQVPLVLQVTNSSNGCINVNGPQGSSQGRATATVTPSSTVTYTLDYPLALNTGTDYYFWAYPNGTSVDECVNINSVIIKGEPGYYLDLNGRLDGVDSGNITGYGTVDIYINSSKVGTGRTDWWKWYPTGTTYSIQNIQATTGHVYAGVVSGSTSGTLNATANVRLSFNTVNYTITATSGTSFVTVTGGGTYTQGSTVTLTATVGSKTGATTSFDGWYLNNTRVSTNTTYTFTATATATYTAKGTYTWNSYYLDLNGWLDGASSGGISGYGTCDVYINGTKVATSVTDYYQQSTYGSTYEITNIKPTSGHTYIGVRSGSLTGTIGASTTQVVLEFKTNSNVRRAPYIYHSSNYKVYIPYVYHSSAWKIYEGKVF